DNGAIAALSESVKHAGYSIEFANTDELSGALQGADLLVVSDARALPVETITPVKKYLDGGGNIIACGLPAWERLTSRIDGKWVTRSDYEKAVSSTKAENVLVDFAKEDVIQWNRSTN